ncbi:MAG: hypothetical protein LJE89_16280 [Deltaproteobacteria bacterium]|nr:hypothetical protein [Deltaproteobacteria bacterium]
MADNITLINDLFERREGSRYPGGYAYFCQKCGMECNVAEASYECQEGRILPLYIKCRYGCGRSWHLKIFPSGKVNPH